MAFFNSAEPLLRPKQSALDVQDLKGLWKIHWQIGSQPIIRSHYTRIDQIFIFWGIVAGMIFATAQFTTLTWSVQAWLWSFLSLGTAIVMTCWTWCWTGVEQLRWLIWLWLGLLFIGVGLTDYSIVTTWGFIMGHLCHLWLILCAVGYFLTGFGLRSRSLLFIGLLHVLGCSTLSLVMSYQFMATGLIMSSTLLLLGEYQWDMRPPTTFANLTPEQQGFNQRQHQLRMSGAAMLRMSSQ